MAAYGSEYKYAVNVVLPSGDELEHCDFEITTYTNASKGVTFKKTDSVHIKNVDANTYKVIIDKDSALKIGRGKVMARIVIHIPDDDYPDLCRTEVYDEMYTGWTIT